jgi:molybdopterin synthase sulfur carrier subunit
MRLLYFAWIRERIGHNEEELTPPDSVATVGELIDWLKDRGPEYQHALSQPQIIRVALDQVHADREAPIAGVREVALFPPMTGG